MSLIRKEDINEAAGWVIVKAPRTERIVAGAITELKYDSQGDYVDMGVFTKRLPWVCQHSQLVHKHGRSQYGVVLLGDFWAYKIDKDKAYIAAAVHEGNEIIDDIWKNEIQPLAHRAGFSIGGGVPAGGKECAIKDGRRLCDISDAVICEISWTPQPANSGAHVTHVNQLAKQAGVLAAVGSAALGALAQPSGAKPATGPTETDEEEKEKCKKADGDTLQKPCPDKLKRCVSEVQGSKRPDGGTYTEEQAYAICHESIGKDAIYEALDAELTARIERMYEHVGAPTDASVVVMGCGTCDDFVANRIRMGKSVAQAMLALDNLINKGKPPEKDAKAELKPMPGEQEPKPPEKEDFEKRCKAMEDKLASFEKAFAELQKAFEASRKEIVAPVGTGEPPLKGVPSEAGDPACFALNATTKQALSDEAILGYLVKKGYKFEGYQKVETPAPKGDVGNPSGLQKTEPIQKGKDPLAEKLARSLANMKKMRTGEWQP